LKQNVSDSFEIPFKYYYTNNIETQQEKMLMYIVLLFITNHVRTF